MLVCVCGVWCVGVGMCVYVFIIFVVVVVEASTNAWGGGE